MTHYPDRFHMTPEQSLFLAKKKWDENVYCGMRMENRNITFPQTKTILQGINVPSVQLDDRSEEAASQACSPAAAAADSVFRH